MAPVTSWERMAGESTLIDQQAAVIMKFMVITI